MRKRTGCKGTVDKSDAVIVSVSVACGATMQHDIATDLHTMRPIAPSLGYGQVG